MATLLCFGFGYSARHYVAQFGARFDRVIATVRSSDKADRINADSAVEALVFAGAPTAQVGDLLAQCDVLLVSTPPGEAGDPVLAAFSDTLAHEQRLQTIVYLSTVGVYGDHQGAWVDETSELHAARMRGRARIQAETAWQALSARRGERRPSVAVLRLAGIYGPGRSALTQVANGTARRIIKPGQVFNRIHVADIAQTIEAALARHASGIFNVSDDAPAPPQDVIRFAAELLKVSAPAEIPFAEAARNLSPMALSFYADCRRVRNERIKRELGVALRFPTYREGLRALHADSMHSVSPQAGKGVSRNDSQMP
jgi:nucleoside-diphosphate-sugar epimerase